MKKRFIITFLLITLLFSNASYAAWEHTICDTNFSSEAERLFQDVSMLSLSSTAMLVNGATRYLDDDNLKLTPKLINARTYISLDAAETLFNAYTEKDDKTAYVDFRVDGGQSSDSRLVLNKTQATVNGSEQSKNEYLVYIDGVAYMPLRKLSETLGNTVYYDNGYILIGKSDKVNAVMADDTYLKYGKDILDKFIPTSAGNEIFVSPTGSNRKGNGTIDSPYQTITWANGKAQPGDTIYLREGTYRDTIAPANSGTPVKPITYKAYNGEKVVISALEEISGFKADETSSDANIVVADTKYDMGRGKNMLFYNGKAVVEARFPNVTSSDYAISDVSPFFPTLGNIKHDYTAPSDETVSSTETAVGDSKNLTTTLTRINVKKTSEALDTSYTYYRGEDGNYYTYNSNYGTYNKQSSEQAAIDAAKTQTSYKLVSDLLNSDSDGKWVGATVMTLHGGGWNWGSGIVKSSTAGSIIVDKDTVTKKWWFNGKSSSIDYAYITDHKNAIDIPTEWNITDGKLYIYLPEGETADSLKVEVKARQLCADLREKKYIQLDGLEFVGGSLTLNNSEMCIIKNCNMRNTTQFSYSLDNREGYIDTATPKVSGAPERGEAGIYFGGTNDVLRDCEINETAGAGIYMTGLYTMVKNNNLINCGYAGATVGGIYIGTKGYGNAADKRGGYVIKYNTVRNTARSPLCLQTSEGTNITPNGKTQAVYIPCEISYNEFANGGVATLDVGVTYMWGATMGRTDKLTQFHHNIAYNDSDVIASKGLLMLVYFDNWVNSVEASDNIIFHTMPGGATVTNDKALYIQHVYAVGNADVVSHDNKLLNSKNSKVYSFDGGLSALKESDYPDSLKFTAGYRN